MYENPLKPILHLYEDSKILEIMINNFQQVFVEENGELVQVESPFASEESLQAMIVALANSLGRKADESNPIIELRLPDGARATAVIPPIALDGSKLVIRKVTPTHITWDNLLEWGVMTAEMKEFIEACVKSRLNILIAGGTGSGKTTILNLVCSFIPQDERVIIVQDHDFLSNVTNHTLKLETRPANIEGRGEINSQTLVNTALHMRPDRVILSEASGAEVLNWLQGVGTGIDGSLTTIHATSSRDALDRMESMMLMGNPTLPLLTARQLIASGIDIILHQKRLIDGSRKLVQISEVMGLQGDMVKLEDIFVFHETAVENGKIIGRSLPTGRIPAVMERIQRSEKPLSLEIFNAS